MTDSAVSAKAPNDGRRAPGVAAIVTTLFATPAAWFAKSATTDGLACVALALVWALGHGFSGIEGDARIYMGRALADVDPLGVGRDMMFAHDGQSSFTLFRLVARTLVARVGLDPTVLVLTLAAMAAWFAAIVVFVRAIVPGRASILVLATAFLLPRLYTPWNLLAAGEATPVPRPFAEAGVLLALAALCQGRYRVGAAWLFVAALVHPIMAAPGFGVLLILLGLRDRRWWIAAAVGALAIVGAGLAGVPLAARLFVRVDPAWLAILRERVDYIFVSLWPHEAWGPPIVRIVTILIALIWVDSPTRRVFGAAAVVSILGLVAALVFGDMLLDLLVIQAQPWRALWLVSALAPVAAGICLWRLRARGAGGRIALACLALAWIALDWYPVSPLAAVCASAAAALGPRLAVSRASVIVIALLCAILAVLALCGPIAALAAIVAKLPAGVPLAWTYVWAFRLPALPIMGLVLLWWRWPDAVATRIGAMVVVVLGSGLLAMAWDTRSAAQIDMDAGHRKPDLEALLDTRPGPVLWIDGDAVWYWLRRPNWNGATQGGSIVFSRELALLWHARTMAMVDHGLAPATMLSQHTGAGSLDGVALGRQDLRGFCAAPDAPVWIVTALDAGATPPPDPGIRIWSPPIARWKLFVTDDEFRWRRLDRYALIPCAAPIVAAGAGIRP